MAYASTPSSSAQRRSSLNIGCSRKANMGAKVQINAEGGQRLFFAPAALFFADDEAEFSASLSLYAGILLRATDEVGQDLLHRAVRHILGHIIAVKRQVVADV